MEDEKQPTPPEAVKVEPTVTPASNQNLIIGIVLGAVVLLLLLLVISQQFESGQEKEDPEVAALKQKIKDEQEAKEKRERIELSGISVDPAALVTQIKNDTDALASLITQSQANDAALRAARADTVRLDRLNQDLSGQLAQYRAAAQRAETLQRQLDQERLARAGMVDESQVKQLRSELELAKAEVTRLQGELAKQQANQAGMVDSNTYALLKADRDQLREINRTLRDEIQRLLEVNGANLFVTQDDLSPRAVALYRALKKIEREDHRKRRETYATLKTTIKADVRASILFKTNSATVGREHEAELKDMAVQAPENSFFLVVGYASTSGDSQTNEELSSRRATRVASMVNYLKKSGQGVQAVYLGEGTRFGPEDSPNQVCEVWEIRP